MKKIKMTAGIIWAFTGLILIIILFPELSDFSKAVSQLPFMKINPNLTGGEIAFQQVSPTCTLVVRKPVFDGLLKERKNGFVQIDWRGKMPEKIADTIDFDRDGRNDFFIRINSKTSETDLKPLNQKVGGVNVSTVTSYGWAVRVNLKR